MRFGQRLAQAIASRGPLCVGIDPHPHLLRSWGLSDTADGLRTFSLTVIEAVGEHVAAVKPQAAFFERLGAAGMAVLEEVVDLCQKKSLICIVDAKRGDIGSTMAGYGEAFVKDGGPFAADAVTVSPFLGVESLQSTADLAMANKRGLFILALTSNPEGASMQHAKTPQGDTVAARVVDWAARQNADAPPMGDVGVVVGVTVGKTASKLGVGLNSLNGPILAPGLGAQGGAVEDLPSVFGSALSQVVVNSSREILTCGPDPSKITRAAQELSTRLGSSPHNH